MRKLKGMHENKYVSVLMNDSYLLKYSFSFRVETFIARNT